MSSKILHKDESYYSIGLCMDVHNELGKGFSEAVYGDALEKTTNIFRTQIAQIITNL